MICRLASHGLRSGSRRYKIPPGGISPILQTRGHSACMNHVELPIVSEQARVHVVLLEAAIGWRRSIQIVSASRSVLGNGEIVPFCSWCNEINVEHVRLEELHGNVDCPSPVPLPTSRISGLGPLASGIKTQEMTSGLVKRPPISHSVNHVADSI